MCSSLYYKTVGGFCFKYVEIETDYNSFYDKRNFTCYGNSQIDAVLVNDLVVDCVGAEDEIELVNLLIFQGPSNCPHPHELPCRKGHTKYFVVTEICIY